MDNDGATNLAGMLGLPAAPMSPLAESALAVHEMFLSFVAAGFAEAQALGLVANILVLQQERSAEGRVDG